MKLLFSEARSDYAHYIFPYSIWGFPEPGETPADLFNAGFLPSSRQLDRFYLCRQLRVALAGFKPSSENRRILRKGEGIRCKLLPRAEFEFSAARRTFCKSYADARFGDNVMSDERLDSLFHSPVTNHVLVFTDAATGAEVGIVTLYLEAGRVVFYYYAFYDLTHPNRSLGLFMMTTAVQVFAERGFQHVYLGTCYSEAALYKAQFAGVELFNGFKWSGNLAELKHLIARDQTEIREHLLENEAFRKEFHQSDINALAALSSFQVPLKKG
ncbi:MAG: hypothetical protein U1F65_01515 [Verrucomicrobiota bacterium]